MKRSSLDKPIPPAIFALAAGFTGLISIFCLFFSIKFIPEWLRPYVVLNFFICPAIAISCVLIFFRERRVFPGFLLLCSFLASTLGTAAWIGLIFKTLHLIN